MIILVALIVSKKRKQKKESPPLEENELQPRKSEHAPFVLSNITIVTKIGSGNYGDVFKGKWEEPVSGTKINVALKKLKNMQHAVEFERETAVLM